MALPSLVLKRGKQSLAGRIAGAAEHLREQILFETESTDRSFRNAFLSELKTQMDETGFSKFYEEGRKLKPEESMAITKVPEY